MNRQIFKYSPECRMLLDKWSNPDVIVPNLLLIQPQNEGVGAREFVWELARVYHEKSNRRAFDKSFLSLKYPTDISGQETRRFFDSPRIVADYYNRFVGIFCIEITDYLRSLDLLAFNVLMRYVIAHKSDVQFIFIVSTNDKTSADAVHDTLKRHIRIDRLTMEHADPKLYVNFAMELLKINGIPAERGVESILAEYIEVLSAKAYFSGYETISRLVEDVIYEMHSDNLPKVMKSNLEKNKEIYLADVTDSNIHNKIGF